jgi:galactoside O-acetyltransferase
LQGKGNIIIKDFSTLSSRVAVYSSNDDYGGEYMTNPTVPKQFTNVKHEDVVICEHVIVGSGSIILPGVIINKGAAIGALSLVNKNCEEFFIYKGNPAVKLRKRSSKLLQYENELFQQ